MPSSATVCGKHVENRFISKEKRVGPACSCRSVAWYPGNSSGKSARDPSRAFSFSARKGTNPMRRHHRPGILARNASAASLLSSGNAQINALSARNPNNPLEIAVFYSSGYPAGHTSRSLHPAAPAPGRKSNAIHCTLSSYHERSIGHRRFYFRVFPLPGSLPLHSRVQAAPAVHVVLVGAGRRRLPNWLPRSRRQLLHQPAIRRLGGGKIDLEVAVRELG